MRKLFYLILIYLIPFAIFGQVSKIKDIPLQNTNGNSGVIEMVTVGNKIYFAAGDGALWVSDGTTEGTVIVKKFLPFNFSDYDNYTVKRLFNLDGSLIFFLNNNANEELWRSDGTSSGTYKITNVSVPHPNPSGAEPIVISHWLYFVNIDSINRGQLWKTDGTFSGTYRVKFIYNYKNYVDPPSQFINLKNNLYFWVNDSIHGMALWKSDGTDAGTQILKVLTPAFVYRNNIQTVSGNYLYFSAYNGTMTGLWRTDGTDSGTVFVRPFSSMQNLVDLNGTLYFDADTNGLYYIGKSDGTQQGTHFLSKSPGSSTFNLVSAKAFGNSLIMALFDTLQGRELWRLDNNANSPVLIKDIWNGPSSSLNNLDSFKLANGILYFDANDGIHGYELWRTDGTAQGTFMVEDIIPGIRSSSPHYITYMNGDVYFIAFDDTSGVQLWKYGTKSDIKTLKENDLIQAFVTGQDLIIKNIDIETSIYRIELYDITGKIVSTFIPHSQDQMINTQLPELNQGVYVCTINTSQGIINKKLFISSY